MIERKLTGEKPAITLPKGTVDSQCHMYLPGFPALPGGPPNPPDPLPTPAMYRQMADWLGIDRVVITQGSAQQRDNGNLLACLAEMGDAARGVAVVDGETTDAEMQSLSDARIVGARVMDLPGGAVGLDELETVDALAAAHGWMLAVQFDGSDILEHEKRLSSLKCRWILDHHGKFFRGADPNGAEIAAVKRLIDTGKCWFKLAGCYESSLTGGPDYADIAANARAIAAHAPERLLWGTNWPHNLAKTTEEYPDDGQLLDTVLGWLDEDTRQKALVTNPQDLFGFPRSDGTSDVAARKGEQRRVMPVARAQFPACVTKVVIHCRNRQEHAIRQFLAGHPPRHPCQRLAFARRQRVGLALARLARTHKVVADLVRRHVQHRSFRLDHLAQRAAVVRTERHQRHATIRADDRQREPVTDAIFPRLVEHAALPFLEIAKETLRAPVVGAAGRTCHFADRIDLIVAALAIALHPVVLIVRLKPAQHIAFGKFAFSDRQEAVEIKPDPRQETVDFARHLTPGHCLRPVKKFDLSQCRGHRSLARECCCAR